LRRAVQPDKNARSESGRACLDPGRDDPARRRGGGKKFPAMEQLTL